MSLWRKKTLTEASPYSAGMEDGWALLWPSGEIFQHGFKKTRAEVQQHFDDMFRDHDSPHTGEPEPAIVPVIRTKEGLHAISEGDWIATGPQGERYPIKADIFAATYEAAS